MDQLTPTDITKQPFALAYISLNNANPTAEMFINALLEAKQDGQALIIPIPISEKTQQALIADTQYRNDNNLLMEDITDQNAPPPMQLELASHAIQTYLYSLLDISITHTNGAELLQPTTNDIPVFDREFLQNSVMMDFYVSSQDLG